MQNLLWCYNREKPNLKVGKQMQYKHIHNMLGMQYSELGNI